jgi:hypothetical protein
MAANTGASATKPRSPRLPNMPIAADETLDQLCQTIRDARDLVNANTEIEDNAKASALDRMMKTKRQSYKAHGVELLYAHTDKLRVRRIDDDSATEE